MSEWETKELLHYLASHHVSDTNHIDDTGGWIRIMVIMDSGAVVSVAPLTGEPTKIENAHKATCQIAAVAKR